MYELLRPLAFSLPPERAHALALATFRSFGRCCSNSSLAPVRAAPIELMGLSFPNRVGLAAGFDKNAVAVDGLGALGFGFIEVGTVTPRPQPGREAPRLFRLTRHDALINRLGFPNKGAEAVVARLRMRRWRGIVGVNIGKNATTPLARAVDDYLLCLRTVYPVADYVAINISSPNTEKLRALQQAEHLEPLLTALLDVRSELQRSSGRRVPLAVKLAPDLSAAEIDETARILVRLGFDGVIATNTTVSRKGVEDEPLSAEAGGLSGPPLHALSLEVVGRLRDALGPAFPIIGVGGIDSPERARAMISAGAQLVQFYTGMIYRGPGLVGLVRKGLAAGG